MSGCNTLPVEFGFRRTVVGGGGAEVQRPVGVQCGGVVIGGGGYEFGSAPESSK